MRRGGTGRSADGSGLAPRAILGGIGSVPGRRWAGYLSIACKDVALFALFAAMLVLRPHGQPVGLANDQFRARPA